MAKIVIHNIDFKYAEFDRIKNSMWNISQRSSLSIAILISKWVIEMGSRLTTC